MSTKSLNNMLHFIKYVGKLALFSFTWHTFSYYVTTLHMKRSTKRWIFSVTCHDLVYLRRATQCTTSKYED